MLGGLTCRLWLCCVGKPQHQPPKDRSGPYTVLNLTCPLWFVAQVMPRSVWETLSPRAQEITRFMIPDEGEPPLETGPVPNGEHTAAAAAAAADCNGLMLWT
eukprot:COSAG04_NODE_2255_length_4440_cov_25.402952_4_plen_102_part_00